MFIRYRASALAGLAHSTAPGFGVRHYGANFSFKVEICPELPLAKFLWLQLFCLTIKKRKSLITRDAYSLPLFGSCSSNHGISLFNWPIPQRGQYSWNTLRLPLWTPAASLLCRKITNLISEAHENVIFMGSYQSDLDWSIGPNLVFFIVYLWKGVEMAAKVSIQMKSWVTIVYSCLAQ